MAADWPEVTVADLAAPDSNALAAGPFGSSIGARFFTESGVPLIRGSNLSDRVELRLSHDDLVFVAEETAHRFERSVVRQGDLVFTCWGTIGQVGLIDSRCPYPRYLLSNKQMKLTPHPDRADSLFLYYLFSGPELSQRIKNEAIGSSVPGFNLGQLRGLRVRLPPLGEQKAIAHILGTLDDKIELNRRMNQTLEAMAQALFQSWFVDFGPVRAKAEGRHPEGMDEAVAALFPGRLVDSETGTIPEGWSTTSLNEGADFVMGGDWGKEAPSEAEPAQAYCIRGADIPALQAGELGALPTRFLKEASLEKRALRAGDLVLEISGGSPTQSTGRTVLVTDTLLRELGAPVVCSNFCRLVRPKHGLSHFLHFWLRWLYDRGVLFEYETGTTGIKNFGFTSFAAKRRVVLPPAQVLSVFEHTVSPWLDLRSANGINSRTLGQLRDSLLPKLLSGELRVTQAEAWQVTSTSTVSPASGGEFQALPLGSASSRAR
jgi:type I restriction enzyme S subunit